MFAALLALALVMSLPLVARAGFGSLTDRLKKKATETVTGKPAKPADSNAAAASDQESPDTNVIVISAGTLARFEKGLRAEAKRRAEVEALLRAIKTPQQHQGCEMEWVQSEEGQKLNAEIRDAGTDGTRMEALMKRRTAAVEAHCGHDPSDYEYKRQLQASIPAAGADPSGMSGRQYSIMRERVLTFLARDKKAWHVRGDEKGPGDYVFDPSEVDALTAEQDALHGMLQEQL